MQTYYSIAIGSADKPYGLVAFAAETVAQAIAKAASDLAYYSIVTNRPLLSIELQLKCARCHGDGLVSYGKRIKKQKRCPDCKGKQLGTIERADFALNESTLCNIRDEFQKQQSAAALAYTVA